MCLVPYKALNIFYLILKTYYKAGAIIIPNLSPEEETKAWRKKVIFPMSHR